MRSKLSLFLVMMLVVLMFVAVGCGDTGEADVPADDSGDEAAAGEDLTIAVFLPSLEFTFFAAMVEHCAATADELGITVQVIDGENSQEKQVRDIEDAISMGVDGMVIIPITAEGANLAIQDAMDAGIPVVTVDRTSKVDVIAHVGADFTEQGRIAARLFIEGLEEKYPDEEQWDIVEIQGTPGASATTDRGAGMNEIFDAEPRINVVAALTGEFTTTDGRRVAEDQLTANPGLHGILAHNDMMGHGVIEAAREAGALEQLVIVAIDGQVSFVQEVLNGVAYATVSHDPYQIVTGIKAVYDHINGNEVEKLILLEADPIRQEDAQEALDSGMAF